MKKYLFLLFFWSLYTTLVAQGWDRKYPNISNNEVVEISRVLPHPDGGYLALATDRFSSTADGYLVKLNAAGEWQWQKQFGSNFNDLATDLIYTADGGVAVIANSFANGGAPPYRLTTFAKFDNNYNLTAQTHLCSMGDMEDCYNILPAQNGGYWVSCVTFWPIFKGYLKRMDDQGNVVQLVETGLDSLVPQIMLPDVNGGLKVIASDRNFTQATFDWALIRYDAAGNLLSKQTYGTVGDGFDMSAAASTPDGGLVVITRETDWAVGTSGDYLFKIDPTGNIEFKKEVSAGPTRNIVRVVVKPDGSGYRLLGKGQDGTPFWAQTGYVDVDLAGNMVNEVYYHNIARGEDLYVNNNLETVIVGARPAEYNTNPQVAWAVKLNANGQFTDAGVAGQLLLDENNDCTGDKDSLVSQLLVYALQNNTVAGVGQTDSTGHYFIPLMPGSYDIVVKKPNVLWSSCMDTLGVQVTAGDTLLNTDFALFYNNFPVTSMSGYVFRDYDGDCVVDSFETEFFEGWSVGFGMSEGNNFYSQTTTTDANGYYSFVLPPGFTNAADRFIFIQNNGQNVICNYNCAPETGLDFATEPNMTYNLGVGLCDTIVPCPLLTTSIGAISLRPCFPSEYSVVVRNDGTGTANDASVEITIDSNLTVLSTSIPWTTQNGNVYSFDLGDMPPYFAQVITIQVFIACDEEPGITYCSEAHAYPDTLCDDGFWNGPNIEVKGVCVGDSVVFTITNTGSDMLESLEYIVIEDNVLLLAPTSFELSENESTTVTVAANGAFLRLETEQATGFPGLGDPVAWVEGCNGNGQFSMGFVNGFSLGDGDPWLDINCTESVNSYDPNDKRGFPAGVSEAHYIRQNTELEYVIRFQNTGTAPALYVEIRDTLPFQWLDARTVVPGASSHPYEWDMQGNGVVVFRFPNINLPDSASNPAASQGYVQFNVQQYPDVPLGTELRNQAAIYFDNNAPIITNQTWHTIGENFLPPSGTVAPIDQLKVQVWPNPVTHGQAQVRIQGPELSGTHQITLTDPLGRPVLTQSFAGNVFGLRTGTLPGGVYAYTISKQGQPQARGVLVIAE